MVDWQVATTKNALSDYVTCAGCHDDAVFSERRLRPNYLLIIVQWIQKNGITYGNAAAAAAAAAWEAETCEHYSIEKLWLKYGSTVITEYYYLAVH